MRKSWKLDVEGTGDVISNSNGNVGIGVPAPTFQLQLSTDSAGKPTGGSWLVSSDRRVKKDITPFNDGLNVLMEMHPVRYRLNGKAGTPLDAEGISVIAQDIQPVAPYTIRSHRVKLEPTDAEETDLLEFDGSPLLFVMINAIKEQQAQIERLRADVAQRNAEQQ